MIPDNFIGGNPHKAGRFPSFGKNGGNLSWLFFQEPRLSLSIPNPENHYEMPVQWNVKLDDNCIRDLFRKPQC